MCLYQEDIGIDLGTATVLLFRKGQGIVLHEPSVVAIDKKTDKIIAVGEDARSMLGRTPGHIVAIRPLRNGVIADYDTTERMLTYFINKAIGKKLLMKPRVVVCIPIGATDVEERAVRQAALNSGAREAFIIEEPLAAALGAGINISSPAGNMVVDIGGGTCDVAVLSLGGVVCNTMLRIGGDHFDEAIIRYVRKEHNLMIGERTAEEIKIKIGTAMVTDQNRTQSISVRGRDLITGLPKTIDITSEESWLAIQEPVFSIIEGIRKVLEITPPELSADIVNNGIVMTGGGSLLDGLDILVSKMTNLPVNIADDPIACVARGTGKVLNEMTYLHSRANHNTRTA
ncbi:MAG TPA: rod shape-determining protein MreB [Syntrophomonadaceae bacterium]|nr:rod shape-determining protein MreB [Syntrophomonadaceae bacterium]HNX28111.1 rod shape-determining protein MreB [Syntrophomonadaceae bacterium]HPR93486.1 rod shape-determining protein MreB [Syntrophomonadaceae bacterium]